MSTENKDRIGALVALIGGPIKHSTGTESGIPALREIYLKFAEDMKEERASKYWTDLKEALAARESMIRKIVSTRNHDKLLFEQALVLFAQAHAAPKLDQAIITLLQSKDLAVNSLRLADALAPAKPVVTSS